MSNRPEPYSSPSAAKAPLISNVDTGSDHRAFTKGVNSVTRVELGKMGTKASKGFTKVTPAKSKPKKVRRSKK